MGLSWPWLSLLVQSVVPWIACDRNTVSQEEERCLEGFLQQVDGCICCYLQLGGHHRAQGIDQERHPGALPDAEVARLRGQDPVQDLHNAWALRVLISPRDTSPVAALSCSAHLSAHPCRAGHPASERPTGSFLLDGNLKMGMTGASVHWGPPDARHTASLP